MNKERGGGQGGDEAESGDRGRQQRRSFRQPKPTDLKVNRLVRGKTTQSQVYFPHTHTDTDGRRDKARDDGDVGHRAQLGHEASAEE